MQLNNLLRFDYWLDASVVNQPAGRTMWLAVAAGVVIAVVAVFLAQRRRLPRSFGLAWAGVGALLSLVGIGRIFAIPVLGLRLGWLIAGVLAFAPVAARVVRTAARDGFADDCVRALAFAPLRPREADWHLSTAVAWLVFHLGGLAVVLTNIELRGAFALPLLALLALPVLVSMALRLAQKRAVGLWRLSALSPLVILYAIALLSASKLRIEGVLNGIFYLPLALIVLSAYAFAISSRLSVAGAVDVDTNDRRFVRAGAALLAIVCVTWAGWAFTTLRTHGVTGSDPFAYAQMGVDLAARGTVFHEFPLVRLTYDLGIASYPVTHIGYRIPTDATRMATTVWPPGYAVFTALAYLVVGETGLYFITPLFGLMALAVAAWFALRIAPRTAPFAPLAVAALTVLLTATSYQQIEWQMIPMADIAAQVFTLLALGLALYPRRKIWHAVLSGLALGLAFDIRYTQVLAAPAIALAFVLIGDDQAPIGKRLMWIVVAGICALVAALPLLIYHQLAFGSMLATGSEELGNFSVARMPETLAATLAALNSYREYGLLTPLMLAGVLVLARRNLRVLAVLAAFAVILFGFHVVYAYLRLRDILFLFPVLSALAAIGAVEVFAFVQKRNSLVGRLVSISLVCAMAFAFTLRAMETIAMPATRGFSTFGYLVREQRASFDKLRALTPENAVIGCSLNSGAVDLYARRQFFRPATWSAGELTRFVDRVHSEGMPVYIVNDGDELRDSLATLRSRYTLREAGTIDVPYYNAIGGGSQNRRVDVYEVADK